MVLAKFQCSSASRKFLNFDCVARDYAVEYRFQCSSASRKFLNLFGFTNVLVSFCVSVLFSEPKISQCWCGASQQATITGFSALQRAENFSIGTAAHLVRREQVFQCSSASRKFLNSTNPTEPPRLTSAFQCSSASRKFLNIVKRAL